MDKQTKAQYLVNLLAIMSSRDANGRLASETLSQEYNRVYDDFVEDLRREKKGG